LGLSGFLWDYLDFSLNGQVLGKWSGRIDWKKFEFPLQAGMNRLEWRYKKDSSTFAGMDAVFIDNVFLPEPPPDRLEEVRVPAPGRNESA